MIAYVAGFFDGEGSIGIYRNGGKVFYLRTQLTQNVSAESTALLGDLCDVFGGNLGTMQAQRYRNGRAYNWQINGTHADKFLHEIIQHLRLKRLQAQIAIAWQAQHPTPQRDARGRMVAADTDRPIDIGAAQVLKLLKRNDASVVMATRPDLAEVVRTLGVAAQW